MSSQMLCLISRTGSSTFWHHTQTSDHIHSQKSSETFEAVDNSGGGGDKIQLPIPPFGFKVMILELSTL